MIIRNHSADHTAYLNFTDSLIIPVDLDGSVVIMDNKGSLGANHAGVCMVVKLGTAFSLDGRSQEGTQPSRLYGSYGLRGCYPPARSITRARNQSPVADLRE